MGASDQIVQDPDMQPQEQTTSLHVPDRRLKVGEQLPARMTAQEVAEQFGISLGHFYALVKAGKFDQFEILPQIGPRAWSGKLLAQYFDGQAVRTFGRKVR